MMFRNNFEKEPAKNRKKYPCFAQHSRDYCTKYTINLKKSRNVLLTVHYDGAKLQEERIENIRKY